MADLWLFATLLVVLFSTAFCWLRNHDPLHPQIMLGAMFTYMYFLRPFLLGDALLRYISEQQLEFCLAANLVGVTLFCVGLNWGGTLPRRRGVSVSLSPADRRRLYQLGIVLGFIAVAAYWFTVFNSGGFFKVYSTSKGYTRSPSGYIGEARMLAFPAIILIFLARRHLAIRGVDVALAILFASPHLLHGILGARRGPTFLVLATLLFSWFGAAGRRMKLLQLGAGVGVIVALLFVLITYRGSIYIGSDVDIESNAVLARAFPTEVRSGDDFLFGCAVIAVSEHAERHYWGGRLLTTLLVRPIPRQIWPSKYEDTGFGWMADGTMLGFTDAEWLGAIGWKPSGGSSGGFAADLFCEFGWFMAAAAFLLGRGYGLLWRRAALVGGVWVVLFLEALILVVYIPTQSVSAVLHRFAFMACMTLLFWRMNVGGMDAGRERVVRKPAPKRVPPPSSARATGLPPRRDTA